MSRNDTQLVFLLLRVFLNAHKSLANPAIHSSCVIYKRIIFIYVTQLTVFARSFSRGTRILNLRP